MSRSHTNTNQSSNQTIQTKPYKVWSYDRQKRKSITASNLLEFKLRGAEKLGYQIINNNYHYLRVLHETDGTEVEDDQYFQTIEKDTVFLLLRDNEKWQPPGMDALKSALSAIPQIVCDTINSLKLANKSPAWSIKDDQGFITVTLQWEYDNKYKYNNLSDFLIDEPSWKFTSSQPSQHSSHSSYAQFGDKVYSSTFPRPSSSRTKLSYETYLKGIRNMNQLTAYRSTTTLPFKTLSADDFSFIIDHRGMIDDFSSAHDLTSYCDFHCSSLHRDGGSIKVSKSVGTSPILDLSRTISPAISITMGLTTTASMTTTTTTTTTIKTINAATSPSFVDATAQSSYHQKAKKGHVRFMDIDNNINNNNNNNNNNKQQINKRNKNISLLSLINGNIIDNISDDSSETETEENETETETETETTTTTTTNDDNDNEKQQYCERYLLLIDQLSANHKKHLSIKDIGIILERLKSKIIDINKLEKDKESYDCYNWLIKAIIKGDMLREIGVLYNGQYYSLMEHPGYF